MHGWPKNRLGKSPNRWNGSARDDGARLRPWDACGGRFPAGPAATGRGAGPAVVAPSGRLHGADWLGLAPVVVPRCVLGFASGHVGEDTPGMAVHWSVLVFSVVMLLVGLGLIRVLGARGAIAAGLVAGGAAWFELMQRR